jgi:DNA-binding IclR family transcriptional regulator
MPNDRYAINSILRAFQVLDAYTFEKSSYKFSDLVKKLGFNKTTLVRVLASLVKAGVLELDNQSKEYRLTYRLFQIGNIYRDRMDLYDVALPFISKLSSSTEETVHLAVLNNYQVLYIGKIESSQSISIRSRIGSANPCYSTGLGKAILANLDESEIESFFCNVKLERFTPNTLSDPEELRLHLRRIREQGYAIDEGENEAEVKCVAAPIFNSEGRCIASISIAGPVFRMTREKINSEYTPAVKETAQNISRRMGYGGY